MPDANARNLKRRRAQSVALVVPELADEFSAGLAASVERAINPHGVELIVYSTRQQRTRERDLSSMLRTHQLDGAIVCAGNMAAFETLAALAGEAPVIAVDERIAGLDLPFIGADNRSGTRAAAHAALERGHRRIAIVAGPAAVWTAEQRLAGYREGLAAGGVELDDVPIVHGDYGVQSGMEAAARLLSAPARRRPTVLLAGNDLMAIGCVRWCASVGLAVPGAVSVIGFDDMPLAAHVVPALTTVRRPAAAMGEAAGRALLAAIDGTPPPPITELPTELVVRESLGVVP